MFKIKKLPLVILIALLLWGCSKNTSFTQELLLMDTFVRIEIKDALQRDLKVQAADRAIMRMTILEEQFNYFSKDNELAKINSLKKQEKIFLSDNMYKVLKTSKDLYKMTQGAFDVTMGMDNWVLDEKEKTISFKKEGVKINLGGIAKGFIVDEGVKIFKESGLSNALINAGGDMYCIGGGSDGSGWKVGIKDPKSPHKIIMSFKTQNKGVATSGGYERFSHIIDPRMRRPLEKIKRSVTVVANDCMTADGLATALYVLGPQKGLSIIEKLDGAECIIIDGDETYISKGLTQIDLTKVP